MNTLIPKQIPVSLTVNRLTGETKEIVVTEFTAYEVVELSDKIFDILDKVGEYSVKNNVSSSDLTISKLVKAAGKETFSFIGSCYSLKEEELKCIKVSEVEKLAYSMWETNKDFFSSILQQITKLQNKTPAITMDEVAQSLIKN